MEDVGLSKNDKTIAIVGFRTISKNRSRTGIEKSVQEKGIVRCKLVYQTWKNIDRE